MAVDNSSHRIFSPPEGVYGLLRSDNGFNGRRPYYVRYYVVALTVFGRIDAIVSK